MKIVLTGKKSMLGISIARQLQKNNFQIVSTDQANIDIWDFNSLQTFIAQQKPSLVIHCENMIDVQECQRNKDLAFKINHLGTKNIAIICNQLNIKLFAFSTNHVFDGRNDLEYIECSCTNPLNIFGYSMMAAQNVIKTFNHNFILFRLSWLYGQNGPSYVHNLIQKLKDYSDKPIKVLNDLVSTPTSTQAVAEKIVEIIKDHPEVYGIVHLSCQGHCSLEELAKHIWKRWNKDPELECPIEPIASYEQLDVHLTARRSKHNILRNLALREYGIKPMPYWKDALDEFLDQELV